MNVLAKAVLAAAALLAVGCACGAVPLVPGLLVLVPGLLVLVPRTPRREGRCRRASRSVSVPSMIIGR